MSGLVVSKKKLVMLCIVVCVVVVVLIIASIGLMGGGEKTSTKSTDLQELIVTKSNMPSGWKIVVPFSYGSQSPLPGNVTGAGGCGFNWTASSGEGAYLIVSLFNYSSSSEAKYSMDRVLSIISNDERDRQYEIVSVGDYAIKEKLGFTGISGYLNSTDIFFQIGNVTCWMDLSYHSSYQNVDQSFQDLIDIQAEKITAAVK